MAFIGKLQNKIKSLWQFFLEAIFPKNCFGCDKEGEYFCSACFNKVNLLPIAECFLCHNKTALDGLCQTCQEQVKIDKIWPALSYKDPAVKDLIENLKFSRIEEIASILAKFMIIRLKERNFEKELSGFEIMAVPLYPKRRAWRGFNQAELLAKIVSTEYNLTFNDSLVRKKKTKQQALLNKEQRKINMINSFALKNRIDGKKIILIDDVITTGQTIMGAVEEIIKGGAERVIVLTAAHG